MAEKIKSTYDKLIESMSKRERKQFFEEYQELLLSELRLAKIAKDDVSVRQIEKQVEESRIKILENECDPSESV